MSEHLTEPELNDYAEGLLDEAARRRAGEHLADCSACRSAVVRIRSIRAAASRLEPPSRMPARDLWPAIEARIREKEGRTPVRPDTHSGSAARAGGTRRQSRTDLGADTDGRTVWRRPYLLAAAALILVSLSSALTLAVVRGGGAGGLDEGGAGVSTVAEESSTGDSPTNTTFVAGREMEAAFEPTIQELRRALEEDRDQLDPETVQVVEESLRIIDQAIEEAMAALEADPANRAATGSLRAMYDAKLQVLQRAVALARSA